MGEGGFLRKAKNTEFSVPRGSKVGPRKGYSSNLDAFVALGKIQQLLDDPIFKNGVGSEINSVIPKNTSSA